MKLELEEIYKTYFQDVYYFVLAMSKDPHIAEEITQETFFKALKGVKHFQGKCSIKSWLCQISLPCVSTPAGIFLVLRTLLNCLDCIILWNCYKIKNKNHHTFYEMWYAPRQEDNKK